MIFFENLSRWYHTGSSGLMSLHAILAAKVASCLSNCRRSIWTTACGRAARGLVFASVSRCHVQVSPETKACFILWDLQNDSNFFSSKKSLKTTCWIILDLFHSIEFHLNFFCFPSRFLSVIWGTGRCNGDFLRRLQLSVKGFNMQHKTKPLSLQFNL